MSDNELEVMMIAFIRTCSSLNVSCKCSNRDK